MELRFGTKEFDAVWPSNYPSSTVSSIFPRQDEIGLTKTFEPKKIERSMLSSVMERNALTKEKHEWKNA